MSDVRTTTGLREPLEVFYDHNGPENVADRAAAHRVVSGQCPVIHSPAYDGYYVALGWKEVAAALRRPAEFVSRDSVTIPSYPTPFGMVQFDPPEGPSFRRAINPWFTADMAEKARIPTRQRVAEHVDRFAGRGEADLVTQLCAPVPATSTIEALGLPLDKFSTYIDLFHRINSIDPMHDSPEVIDAITGDFEKLVADVAEVVEARYAEPQDDWISVFIGLDFFDRRLRPDEVIANANLFFGGGVDTTAQLTAWTLYYLDADRELRQRLIDDRSLLKPAFDEFLRISSPVQGIARTVLNDLQLGDFALTKQKRLFVSLGAANRDPAVFPEPDVLDIDRDAKRHLGFGVGPHKCLGMHIARVWWEEMISAVLDRIPDYSLTDPDVKVYAAGAINGISSMPAVFTPESSRPPVH